MGPNANSYVEISLLSCYRFLSDGEFPEIVSRISNMIRGVGDPTVALYARMYLAISSSRFLSQERRDDVIIESFHDYLFTFHEFQQRKLMKYLQTHEIDFTELLSVHSPGVEWILRSIGASATEVGDHVCISFITLLSIK